MYKFYFNDDGEKVYFHEELGMRFEWMHAEDIEQFSCGKTAKDHVDDIEASFYDLGITDITILGIGVSNAAEFGISGNSHAKIVLKKDDIIYNNYKITAFKTKLNKLSEGDGIKLSFSYTNDNYYYYVTKLAKLQSKNCHIHPNEIIDNGISSKIKFTYSDGVTVPRRINDILTKTKINVSYFVDDDIRDGVALNRCRELKYHFQSIYKHENGRYFVKYECTRGHQCDQDYHAFTGTAKQSCGVCSKLKTHSYGHNDTMKFLRNLHITITEKTFNDLKDKMKLPYDFYVKDLNALIEYDGSDHFKNKSSRNNFIDRQKKDKMKTEYAINNGYNFLRIAYYEGHLEVLESFLKLIEENPGKQIVQIYGDVKII
ncbi:HNH endonuclease [Escherichia phage vB_Ec-M-J]|nr:HNH endonuclease [Escherichia phage vB_Ec-M-J]